MPEIKNIAQFNTIAVELDFTNSDGMILSHAISLAKKQSKIILLHVIESAGAQVFGK